MERAIFWGRGFALLAAVGCESVNQTIDTTRFHPPYTVSVYQGGRPISQQITPDSEQEAAITHWLESNRSGWRKPPCGRYTPKRLISGHGFELSFVDDVCLLTDQRDGTPCEESWVWWIKPILRENSELDEVFRLDLQGTEHD